MKKTVLLLLCLLILQSAYAENLPSVCYGTTQEGRLENGWQLPSSGKNYEAYSTLGVITGRNYVHSKVYDLVVAAYKSLESTAPDKMFIYGESGSKEG
ncbi:MAG: hypothetical protein PHF31_16140 [Methylobacter sp.]|nr:hypothetical protein [Methylobacter sp.]